MQRSGELCAGHHPIRDERSEAYGQHSECVSDYASPLPIVGLTAVRLGVRSKRRPLPCWRGERRFWRGLLQPVDAAKLASAPANTATNETLPTN